MSGLWTALAGFFSGAMGAMGLGGGGVLIIYLTLFAGVEQAAAQGINLIFFIPCAVLAVLYYWKKKLIVWKTAIPCALAGLLGAAAGSYFSSWISGEWLGKLFAGLLLLMGLKQLIYKAPPKGQKRDRTKPEPKE